MDNIHQEIYSRIEEIMTNTRQLLSRKLYSDACFEFKKALDLVILIHHTTNNLISLIPIAAEFPTVYIQSRYYGSLDSQCEELLKEVEYWLGKANIVDLHLQIASGLRHEHEQTGNYRKANFVEIECAKVLELCEALGDPVRLAFAKVALGNYLGSGLRDADKMRIMEEGLSKLDEIAQAEPLEFKGKLAATYAGRANEGLGNLYFSQGLYSKAIRCYERCLFALEVSNDKTDVTSLHLALANSYLAINDGERAIEHYSRAAEIADKHDDWASLSQIHKSLALIYARRGQETKAIAELNASRTALNCLDEGIGVLSMWIGIGEMYQSHKQLDKALDCFDKAKRMAQQLKRTDVELNALTKSATLSMELQDFLKAKEDYLEARRLAQDLGNRSAELQIDARLRFIEGKLTM